MTGRLSTFGFKHAFKAIQPSIKTVVSGNFDAWQAIRANVRPELVLEPSEKNATAERGVFRESSSRRTPGNSSGISLGPETGTPDQPLLNGVDSDSPQLRSGIAGRQRAFQRELSDAHGIEEDRTTKVLLLGASGSGKSTLFNAMKILTGAEEPRDDDSMLRELVWHNALESVTTILWGAESLDMTEITAEARELLNPCSDCERDPAWNPEHAIEVARTISSLRSNVAFREAVRCRSTYQFLDNSQYYIDNIERLAEQAAHRSAPTNGDLLRTRVRTTGIHQSVLSYNGTRFCVYDVGGERSERKKWIHAFEGVSTVIYPVDTTGYRRRLHEDENRDRMLEQFEVFASAANSWWFAQSSFIIVFTKIDLLEDYMKEEDADAFLRSAGIVFDYQPPIRTATAYMDCLQWHFLGLVKSADARERIRFVRADLVDVDDHNPAIDILNALGGFNESRWVVDS